MLTALLVASCSALGMYCLTSATVWEESLATVRMLPFSALCSHHHRCLLYCECNRAGLQYREILWDEAVVHLELTNIYYLLWWHLFGLNFELQRINKENCPDIWNKLEIWPNKNITFSSWSCDFVWKKVMGILRFLNLFFFGFFRCILFPPLSV